MRVSDSDLKTLLVIKDDLKRNVLFKKRMTELFEND